MKIGVLGATSQIARSIFPYMNEHNVVRFGRKKHVDYSSLPSYRFDMIINCVGVAKPVDIRRVGKKVLGVAKKYDDMCVKYLKKYPSCTYVNMSSGVVLERRSGCYYRLSKQTAEARHRELFTYNIFDLRIFSFFSSFIDLDAGFMMSELVRCLKEKDTFRHPNQNFIRDYIHPEDLANLILGLRYGNSAIDVYSANPIDMNTLIGYFSRKGMKHEVKEVKESPTGTKLTYYADGRHHFTQPRYTSLDTIKQELKDML